MSSENKNLSRRKLLSLAGGAAALLATTRTASAAMKGRKGASALRGQNDHSTARSEASTGEQTGGLSSNAGTVDPRVDGLYGKNGAGPVVRDEQNVADARIAPPAEARQFGPSAAYTEPSAKPVGPQFVEHAAMPASADVVGMLGVSVGESVGAYTVVAIHELQHGAVPVVLSTADGRKFQVDVMRRDSVQAPASTSALSFFLANEGNGSKKSREAHGLGAMALASVVAVRGGAVPARLLTLSERSERFPGGNFVVI